MEQNQQQDQRFAEQVRDEITKFLEETYANRPPSTINEVTSSVRSIPTERLLRRRQETAGTGGSSGGKG